MTVQPSLFTQLEPIDPTTQVTRVPGIDARCEGGKTEATCRWPYCACKFPDRPAYQEEAA